MSNSNDLRNRSSRFRAPGMAKAALQQIVDAGIGDWVDQPPGPQGGRPTVHFVLATGDHETDGDEFDDPPSDP